MNRKEKKRLKNGYCSMCGKVRINTGKICIKCARQLIFEERTMLLV